MFDWENKIALDTMQGNRASSGGEEERLMGFLEFWQEPGVYSRITAGMAI